MKKILQLLLVTSILVIGSAFTLQAQNCYLDYYHLFSERGASVIPDGTHDVVVTIREGSNADCYMARVQVKDNQLVAVDGIILEDGSVKKMGMQLSAKYNDPVNPAILHSEIVDGISSTLLSEDGKQVNFFFIKQLSAKTKAYKKAPPVSSFKTK
jgi:hypothetical protein